MSAATTNQWMHQFYNKQQPLIDGQSLVPQTEGLSFSDSTVMTTNSTTPTNMASSDSILSPKGNVSKPIRRRSRASKRTPTTLLNANTTNFRALVQQFTGCPSTTMPSSSLIGGIHKGPITLNFQQGSKEQVHTNTASRTLVPPFQQVVAASPLLPIWQNNNQQDQVPNQEQLLLLQEHDDQSGGYSFDYVKSNDFVPNHGNSRPSMEVSDGLILDNDFCLHDLTVNAFPNDTTYYRNNQ